jgi:hypothetical protein
MAGAVDDKEIRIAVKHPERGDLSIKIKRGQGVKESVETSTSQTVCFDEVITEGAEKVSYKLEIERVLYETKQEYIDLRDILTAIQHVQGTVETRETIRYKDEDPFTIVKTFGGAILDGNEFEMKPEEKTAHSLTFVCSSKDEVVE